MKRIIVPIDFSKYANNAFLNALKIAEKSGAAITCVNVVATNLDWTKLSDKEKAKHQEILDIQDESKLKLQEFVKSHDPKKVKVSFVIETGVPHERIIALAGKEKADLIVIGAYGKGHESGKFIGSNLQKVLRNAPCPVLGVKKLMSGNDLRKMVFASLFEANSQPAFKKMMPLIKALGTSVHFLFVNTPAKFATTDKVETLMHHFGKDYKDLTIHQHIYNDKEPEKGIMAFAHKKKAGFIGIATQAKKSAAAYHVGVTETVLFKTDIPVLSVKFG